MRAMLWLIALAVVASVSCSGPSTQSCDSKNCTGCCDAQGVCQSGLLQTACGALGAACQPCALTQQCALGQCITTGPTGGGMGMGGGGGSVTGGGDGGGSAGGSAMGGGSGGGSAGGGVGGGDTGGGTGGAATGGGSGGGSSGGGAGGGTPTGGGGGGPAGCSVLTCGGCCNGDVCEVGSSDAQCGKGGATCSACGTDGTCKSGSCQTRTCDFTSCPAGCCNGGFCLGGDSVTACGQGGNQCTVCDTGLECRNQRCQTPLVPVDAGVPSGGSCTQAEECAGTSIFPPKKCNSATLSDGSMSGWVGGYCQSGCVFNSTCPSPNDYCDGIYCNQGCPNPKSGRSTCRDGYVCDYEYRSDGGMIPDSGHCLPDCNNAPSIWCNKSLCLPSGYCL